MNTNKTLTIALLLLAGGLATGTAQAAHRDVEWSVRIATPLPLLPIPWPRVEILHDHGAPAWRDRDRDGVPDWRDRHDDRISWRRHGWGDRDRDGIPDRYDRYDNRHDGRYDHRHRAPGWRHGPDRDRDGIPDRRERWDDRP